MKKTLLVSAFSAIAMVAGAQTEVASAAGEFDFITKNFTVGQNISLKHDFLTALREP